jgi:hypothetical protein
MLKIQSTNIEDNEIIELLRNTLLDQALKNKDFNFCRKLVSKGWESLILSKEKKIHKENQNKELFSITAYYDKKTISKYSKLKEEEINSYINKDIIANNVTTVMKHIDYNLGTKKYNNKMIELISYIRNDIELLYKISIVERQDYRKCVILISETSSYLIKGAEYRKDNEDIFDVITYFKQNAETIFLIFN